MGPYATKAALLVGITVVAVALMAEVRNWSAGRKIISRKQQVLRLSTGILLIILLGLIFFGGSMKPIDNPFLFLVFWMACFVIGCLIVLLVLFDLREMGYRYREMHREMMKQMSEKSKRKQ